MSLITLEITKRFDEGLGDYVTVSDDVARCYGHGWTAADALREWVEDFTGYYEALHESEHRPPRLEQDYQRMQTVLDR